MVSSCCRRFRTGGRGRAALSSRQEGRGGAAGTRAGKTGQLTLVLLLELARDVALDEGRLACWVVVVRRGVLGGRSGEGVLRGEPSSRATAPPPTRARTARLLLSSPSNSPPFGRPRGPRPSLRPQQPLSRQQGRPKQPTAKRRRLVFESRGRSAAALVSCPPFRRPLLFSRSLKAARANAPVPPSPTSTSLKLGPLKSVPCLWWVVWRA